MEGSINRVPDAAALRDREVLYISCQAGRAIMATGTAHLCACGAVVGGGISGAMFLLRKIERDG